MTNRVNLTTKAIEKLKPADAGTRYSIKDAQVPGLSVRVTEQGTRTFLMTKRWPGGKGHPTARSLGEFGELSLAEARAKAAGWSALLQKGIDPREEERRAALAAREKADNTFGAIAEEFITRKLKKQRRGARSEQEIRRDILPVFGHRPITEITKRDVVRLVEGIKDRGAPYGAHTALGHARVIFNWAIARDIYGIDASPCDRIRAAEVLGPKKPRQRVLTDAELAAAWRATDALDTPYGALVRLLMLTGQRRSEVAEARWPEFDLTQKIWTVPPERFKSDASHLVPLSGAALRELARIKRHAGAYVFSRSDGATPVNSFSRQKAKLDSAMAEELGQSPAQWELHDIRRTVRTRLSSLRIPENVAEMIIGHGKRGLSRVYDQHQYVDEMREALEAWATRLRTIVDPPPTNVVPIRAEGAAKG